MEVVRLHDPPDHEMRETLSEDFDTVLLLSEDDVVSLRRALVVEDLRPGELMAVTVYGRSVAGKLQDTVRHAHIMSMADIVAPALAGPCLEDRLLGRALPRAVPRR